MGESRRIVVFTGELTYSVRKGIVDLDDALPALEWLVLLQAPPRTARRLLRNQWLNLRRNGWRWIPYQLADFWQRWRQRGAADGPADAPGREYSAAALRARPNIRILALPSIHAPEAIAQVQAFAPELGLSLAAPILKRPLFSIPRLGTINLHKGKLPEFRGMPPAFWELWKGERAVGCSVHQVDDKLDTGALLAEGRVERAAHATVRGLQLRLDELGSELVVSAVRGLFAGPVVWRPQPSGQGSTHRKPTLTQQAELARRLAEPRPWARRPRHWVKEVRADAALLWHRRLGWRIDAPRITVLLYHRVSDDVRDNLTVGVEQFDRQMALLRQHCRLVSIEEVLATGDTLRSQRPVVAVTFDDGYLDNYLHAAPSLRRHGVPAAFFVSTGIVEVDGRFPHDIRRGNPPIPVMHWDQMRTMQRWGFTIGSHTVNHIDCAGEPEDVVVRELAQSRDDLRRELDVQAPILAYPYGGRQHMTPQRLQRVREAGYVGCLSAYGGTNIGGVDPFNVLRRGIHHGFSDRTFLRECLGPT